MLRKLIKYDLLFGLKRYVMLLILLAGVWLTSLPVSLLNIPFCNHLFLVLHLLASIFFIFGYIVTSLQFIAGSLGGGESYLHYTLPVSTFRLLLSKLLCIWIWGAVTAGALGLIWLSLSVTLLPKIGMSLVPFDGLLEVLLVMCGSQLLLTGCMLVFATALSVRPGLRRLNGGPLVVALATYCMGQIVGLFELGALLLWQYWTAGNIDFLNRDLDMQTDFAILRGMSVVMTAAALVFGVLFFLFAARSLDRQRSV